MNRKYTILAPLAVLSILTGCVSAEFSRGAVASGTAHASNSGEVYIDKKFLTLWGIEAPDLGSSAGWFSRAALKQIIGDGGELVCIIRVEPAIKFRAQAVCSNDEAGDIARAMLWNGWATINRASLNLHADASLVDIYQRAENHAREARIGLWKINAPR